MNTDNLIRVDFQPAPEAALAMVAQHFGGQLAFPSRRFDVRVELPSRSTELTNYVIARNRETGIWSCGCPGWINWHSKKGPGYRCQHLRDLQDPLELALELQVATQPQPLPIPAGVWQQ
jgi:hypothetical protein